MDNGGTKKHKSHMGLWMRGLIWGGIIGAGAALLSAPQSGYETRQVLREKKDEIQDRVDQVRVQSEELIHVGKEKAEDLALRSQHVIEEQKLKAASMVEGIKEGTKTYKESNTFNGPEDMAGGI